jgi:myo-inositol-1-phosphate synthase
VKKKIGVWLVGARGRLASTVIVGARAIARGLAGREGLVTELPELAALPLVGLDQLVFGGWDVVSKGLLKQAWAMALHERALPADLVVALEKDLRTVERRICPGFLEGGGPATRALAARAYLPRREPLGAAVNRLGDDLDRFRAEHKLETVVVVNLASTEPLIEIESEHCRLDTFRQLVQLDRRRRITPSILYAYAALERGFPYMNFTPSLGVRPPALHELAQKHHVPFYGSDGKTGETLVKTVLAPLFRYRNLEVLSWEGFNVLGGGDGQVLHDPRHKRSKVRSKSGVLASILGYAPHTGVFIEYVPSLGNWKTAWDFIHFRGFLGTKMSVQFIWQGCDAVLAAPLVLDLVRLTEFAYRKGEAGPMTHLACFFKDPLGVSVHSFMDQVRLLLDYVARHTRAAENKASVTDRPAGSRKKGGGTRD